MISFSNRFLSTKCHSAKRFLTKRPVTPLPRRSCTNPPWMLVWVLRCQRCFPPGSAGHRWAGWPPPVCSSSTGTGSLEFWSIKVNESCYHGSISPTNLCNLQKHQNKVTGTKDAVLFTNISDEILEHFLSWTFCAECHILADFFQMWLLLKASKIVSPKARLL